MESMSFIIIIVKFHLKGHLDQTMINEYLPQLHKRCRKMLQDFKAAHVVIRELTPNLNNEEELQKYQKELLARIEVNKFKIYLFNI